MKGKSFLLLAFLFTLEHLHAQVKEHLRQEIHKIITFDSGIDFEKTPGLAVGVVLPDTSFFFAFGTASLIDSSRITEETIFEIGELTQVFTAALALKIAPSSPTLRPFLNHTSGLPRFLPGFGDLEHSDQDPYAALTQDHLTDFLASRDKAAPHHQTFLFSNLNYAAACLEIESLTGQPFPELLSKELLDPAGMANTWFQVPDEKRFLLATGYSPSGHPAPLWNPAAIQGAIGLKSTPGDLIRWMEFFLHPGPEWEPVFSELYREPVPTKARKRIWMGYGWHVIYPKKKIPVLLHTGSTGGYMASMSLCPQTKTGVVILGNSPYGASGLGLLVLEMLNSGF